MSTKLYVGNLSFDTDDETLKQAFGEYGTVVDSLVMKDRDTGRSRGFGFVTLSSKDEAEAAIEATNGRELNGRELKVSLADARPPR